MNRLKRPFVSFLFAFALIILLMNTGGIAAASGWGRGTWNIVSSPNDGVDSQLNGTRTLTEFHY